MTDHSELIVRYRSSIVGIGIDADNMTDDEVLKYQLDCAGHAEEVKRERDYLRVEVFVLKALLIRARPLVRKYDTGDLYAAILDAVSEDDEDAIDDAMADAP